MPPALRDWVERNYRFVVLIASMLIFMVGSGSTYLLVVNLKPIAAAFLWPRSVPSLAYSLQFFGGGVGGLVMGYWVDRAGLGRPAMVGAVMIGLGAILMSRITNQWQLFVIYGGMMGALGLATMFSPLMANIVRWFDRGRGMAVGFVASGQGFAGAIWPPIFRHFTETIGWRATYFWFGVFALATMVPLALLLRPKPPAEAPAAAPAPSPVMPSEAAGPARVTPPGVGLSARQLQAALAAAIIGCCVAMAMPAAHLVAYATDLGHSSARAAEMLAVMLATSIVARLLGVGTLADRFGGLTALFMFSALQGASLAWLVTVDSLVALYVAAGVFGLGYGGVIPCYSIIVREYLPAGEIGRRTAAVILFGTLGMALGGWLGGAIFDLTGSYNPAFLVGVAFNLGNLAMVGALIHRARRFAPSAAPG